jgi:hypothetical protein
MGFDADDLECMDFEIANYNLEELLDLFDIPYCFDQNDLKKAKTVVVSVHPDKSGLDKEYFIFFKKAYDLLVELFEYRKKTDKPLRYIEKQTYTIIKDEEKEKLLEKVRGKKNFHKWFNEMFEKTAHSNILKEGHGDWLKSNEDIDSRETTMMGMNTAFERKKTEIKSIVVHKGVQELNGEAGGSLIDDSEIESYEDTKIFSKMRYDDVRNAHTHTVVPVTHQDFLERPQYSSIGHLQNARDGQNIKPLSDKQSQQFLAQRNEIEGRLDARRAYNLLQQEERSKQSAKEWWASLRRIEDQ